MEAIATMQGSPDDKLVCKDCSKTFIFTEGEKAFYKDKGLFPPKRCPICRMEKKKRYQAKESQAYGNER